MNTEYYILNPAGNITALVTSKTEKTDYKTIAAWIFERNPEVEQAGFVKFGVNTVKLNMSGDEFCGNAAMSAAVLYYSLGGLSGAEKISVAVFPEGIPVSVNVKKSGGTFCCEGIFCSPNTVKRCSFVADGREYTFPLVCFKGIMHIVADRTLSKTAAEKVIKNLAADLNTPALGIMIFDESTGVLLPIVYVSAVDTLFCENSCASGCCAVASVLPEFGKTTDIVQKGGIISARRDGGKVFLKTNIEIVKKCVEETDYAKKDGFEKGY